MEAPVDQPTKSPEPNPANPATQGDLPILSLIEWQAPALTPSEAREVAEQTAVAFRRVPGLLDFRFFGDFSTGRHFYLQVWADQAALDAYAASESMFRIREIAAPFVSGRPSRELFADYTPG
jgi:quinol monooxygenase YgiN